MAYQDNKLVDTDGMPRKWTPIQRQQFWLRILEMRRWMEAECPGGLRGSSVYMAALVGLYEDRPMAISDIASITHMDRRTVLRYARQLVEAGWGHFEREGQRNCLVIDATRANRGWRKSIDDKMLRFMDTANKYFGCSDGVYLRRNERGQNAQVRPFTLSSSRYPSQRSRV